jgi:pimeloyl-ACP methyl ester carboxylesterase
MMGAMLEALLALAVALLVGYVVVTVVLLVTYSAEPPVDETHHVASGGGWEVALHRVRPSPAVPGRETPVILSHGIAMCRCCWHMSAEISLARYLADRGHDVWIAEYRGYASSRHRGEGRAWDFSIDEHIKEDAPALIEGVRERTGADRVHWVGHSMGGIILYGYAQAHGTDALGRVVTVGSPVRMGRVAGHLKLLGRLRPLLRSGWRVPLYTPTRLTLPFSVFGRRWFQRPFYNARLARATDIATLFTHGVQDLSARALRQFARWQSTGTMALEDGSGCIEDAPAALDVPFLCLAGEGDLLVPPRAATPAHDKASAEEKDLRVFGGPGDPAPPMGHLDLIASADAKRWVFPEIADWLEKDG